MTLHGRPNDRGFTLVEVIIAIAFMAVAMVGLLRLQVVSIRTTDHARGLSRAALLADAKMAETLAAGCADAGTVAGTAAGSEAPLDWQVTVADAHLDELDGIDGPRSVTVRVSWQDGRDRRHVQLVTYVAAGGSE